LNQIAGYLFDVRAVDHLGHNVLLGRDKLSRVISDEIEFISPSNYQSVSATPTLVWKDYNPGFNFTYTIQIKTNDDAAQTVYEKTRIPSSANNCVIDQLLPSGEYKWYVWCVDDFQNQSRSKPATFIVE
jgi:hypothetical protein